MAGHTPALGKEGEWFNVRRASTLSASLRGQECVARFRVL